MLNWMTRRPGLKRKAGDLYGMVVAAARQPSFYGAERVPDTPEGRLELVALHLFLVAERVKSLPGDGEALAQHLIEAFVTDMDDCMREMGVGDMTVPKRVKGAAALFYDRSGAYRQALAEMPVDAGGSDPLAAIAIAKILRGPAGHAFAGAIAKYIRASDDKLARLAADDIAAGQLSFAKAPRAA
ncbi:MAG: ubiquinol-cytochrome C chaperone family protein [Hyphomicrobium sp.]|nr:ubiquinol-cytochrome C chaperone [Hyphomicrobium sp.]